MGRPMGGPGRREFLRNAGTAGLLAFVGMSSFDALLGQISQRAGERSAARGIAEALRTTSAANAEDDYCVLIEDPYG